jgi:hypothetical protein
VYDNDNRCTRSYGVFDGRRVKAIADRVYVRENRKRPSECHRLGDLHVPEGRYDDLVTDSDAGGPEHCSSTHVGDGGCRT